MSRNIVSRIFAATLSITLCAATARPAQYVVKRGDTWLGLERDFHVPRAAIRTASKPWPSGLYLVVGHVLEIPSQADVTDAAPEVGSVVVVPNEPLSAVPDAVMQQLDSKLAVVTPDLLPRLTQRAHEIMRKEHPIRTGRGGEALVMSDDCHVLGTLQTKDNGLVLRLFGEPAAIGCSFLLTAEKDWPEVVDGIIEGWRKSDAHFPGGYVVPIANVPTAFMNRLVPVP